ncbi:reverse transcriptase [Gossypium australe]|uniref:Reverse transcriptase n=1 Tax=Gossypium australe TaxID=47621 RepID=A0A5B6X0Z7_9ROSI|nr:reverse transcriptase [Gossypium australe]
METKIDEKRMEKVRKRRGFVNGIDVGAEGSRDGLCLAWKREIIVNLRSCSKSHIDVLIKEDNVAEEWRFTRINGQDQNYPWLVSGDFNEIMYSFGKSGGIPRDERRMEAFCEVLEECQLVDRGNLSETNFKEKLDRGVSNEKWIHLFPKSSIRHLSHSISNHCPLILNIDNARIYTVTLMFKFEAWWTIKESIEQ